MDSSEIFSFSEVYEYIASYFKKIIHQTVFMNCKGSLRRKANNFRIDNSQTTLAIKRKGKE